MYAARESGQANQRLILAAALLTLGLVMLATAVSVYAIFTDTDSVTPNDFTSDTLDPATLLGATGGASVDLSWTATVDTYASGHRVLRGTASGGPYSQIADVTPRTTTTYTDSPADGTYYYVVRAFYQNWESVNSNEASATVSSGARVERANAWTPGLTHTAGTGSDRLLLFVVGYENGSDPGVSAVTYGGQSLTPIIGAVAGTTIFGRVELWYLNEAGIAAASGNTFSVTWGGATPSQPMYAAATYKNVNQSNPILDSASTSTDTSTPNPITATVNVVDGAMAVSGAISGNNGSYTWGGGWTEGTDQTSGATTTMSSAENPATTAGTDTASATHSGPNRQAIVAAVLNPATTSVQSGTATISSNGGTNTLTVPITSIDPAKSFLIFETRHNGNRPVNSMIRGRIASATSLEFVRVSNEAAPGVPIDIQWYVVEYRSGVNVQRGEVTQSATTVNVPITAVTAVNQAFVTWSKTPTATDGTFNSDDPIVGELTSTSNLQFRVNGANASHTIWWQVIEFTNPADINVQKGTTSLLGTALSTTVTLGTPVDVTKTFLLVSFRTAGSGADVGSKMLRAQLTDSTTITIDRSISGTPDDITEIVWQAVELKDGSTVQRGSENFASGVAQKTVPITSVVTGRSAAFASVQPVGGQNMGLSPYAGDDIIGVCSVTMTLSSTQITMDRNNTAASCDVGWFVVEFAP